MGLPCCSRQYTVFLDPRPPAGRSGPGSTASAGAVVGRPPAASSPVSRYSSMYAASLERCGWPSAAAAVTGVAEVTPRRHQPASAPSQQPLLSPDPRKKKTRYNVPRPTSVRRVLCTTTAYSQDAVLGGLTTGQRHRQSLCQVQRRQYLPPRAGPTVEHEPYQRDDKVSRRSWRSASRRSAHLLQWY